MNDTDNAWQRRFDELSSIEKLENNWDGEGALRPCLVSAAQAGMIIATLKIKDWTKPPKRISAHTNGRIEILLHDGKTLEV